MKLLLTSVILFCTLLLIAILNTTTPSTIGPFGLLLVFGLAYILFISIVTVFLYETSKMISKLSRVFVVRRPVMSWSLKKSYYYGTVLAAAPIMLIGLQSVGALGFYETLLVIIFCILGCIYVSKRAF